MVKADSQKPLASLKDVNGLSETEPDIVPSQPTGPPISVPIDSLAIPTQQDYEEVMRRNPVAAAQLKEAIWRRMYVELMMQKQKQEDDAK